MLFASTEEGSEAFEATGFILFFFLSWCFLSSRSSVSTTYPVQDETHWVDGDGNVLPDAILIPEGTSAKGLAYAVHSDLGDGFIRATDARSGRVIGADHEVQNGDVIRIHAKS